MPDWRPAPGSSAELMRHLETLQKTLDELGPPATVQRNSLDTLIDQLRWTRFHVDMQLAFQQQVAHLRDADWRTRTFQTPELASSLLQEFRAGLATTAGGPLNHVVLRNFRARLEGTMAVVTGWHARLAR